MPRSRPRGPASSSALAQIRPPLWPWSNRPAERARLPGFAVPSRASGQATVSVLLQNLLDDVDEIQGVFDLGQRDLPGRGDLRETPVLVAVLGHDDVIRERGHGVDHPLVVAPGRAALRFSADMDGHDEDLLLLAELDDLFQPGLLAVEGQPGGAHALEARADGEDDGFVGRAGRILGFVGRAFDMEARAGLAP